jgi:large subunit ribosomal protein L2
MPLIKTKPTSPGRRFVVKSTQPDLHKGDPYGPLVAHKSKSGGRNNKGRITCRHRGGGHKQRYRIIDFKRAKDGIVGRVERLEYDPNRSAHIALILYPDGERRYIIAPKGVVAGDEVSSGADAPIKAGSCLPIRNIPVGTTVHCVELKPGKGAQLARSAGTSVQLIVREGQFATLRLRSGELRRVPIDCRASASVLRQGRRDPLARRAPDGSRCRHESGGSSSRWRRRSVVGRTPPRDALGAAHQGPQDAPK